MQVGRSGLCAQGQSQVWLLPLLLLPWSCCLPPVLKPQQNPDFWELLWLQEALKGSREAPAPAHGQSTKPQGCVSAEVQKLLL